MIIWSKNLSGLVINSTPGHWKVFCSSLGCSSFLAILIWGLGSSPMTWVRVPSFGLVCKPVLHTDFELYVIPIFLVVGVLFWNFYHAFVTVSIEFWLNFEPQIRPTRLEINFLLITDKAKRKVRLCVKLFDFLHRWILIRLTWNLSRFASNSVEILTWNFRKNISGEFYRNFCTNQGYPLTKLVSAIFILRPYYAEKNSHKYFHMLFAPK